MFWSIVRSQTEGSNTEANRLLRLLEVIGLYHGPALGRLGIQHGHGVTIGAENAIMPTSWEKRTDAATE